MARDTSMINFFAVTIKIVGTRRERNILLYQIIEINFATGAGFSGRIKISFPVVGTTPPEDNIIFLLFLVRSDGIVKI